jgi:hypothetical protein
VVGGFDRRHEGRQKKKPEKTTYICASSQKKVRTYLLFSFLFLVRFWAFLGKGVRKHEKKKLSTFQTKIAGEFFFGGIFFPGEFF